MGFPGMSPLNGIQYQVVSTEIIYIQVTLNKTRYIYACVYTICAYCMYFHKYIYIIYNKEKEAMNLVGSKERLERDWGRKGEEEIM